MFRWQNVPDQTLFGMTIKVYRDPFVPADKIIIPNHKFELDHVAYKNLGTELQMYKILDTNANCYLEARGNVSEMDPVYLPIKQNVKDSIL